VVITPTTRGEDGGHDEELTSEEARRIVDYKFGYGMYNKAEKAAVELFKRGSRFHRKRGLILVDTKFEFGVDEDGRLLLIDELLTSDSSRIWLNETYQQRFENGENPDAFDKEILRRWLAQNGFTGQEGTRVPVVDTAIIDQMSMAYQAPYAMITGRNLPETPTDPLALERDIQQAVYRYYNK